VHQALHDSCPSLKGRWCVFVSPGPLHLQGAQFERPYSHLQLRAYRRLFRPARVQANSHGWRKLEMGVPPSPSNFLILPRPDVSSHPLFLRRSQTLPLLAIPEEDDSVPIPPLLNDFAITMLLPRQHSFSSEPPLTPPTLSPAPALPTYVEDSAFCDDESPLPTPTLPVSPATFRSTMSQPLPSLDKLLLPDVEIELQRPDPKLPRVRLKRRSAHARQTSTPDPHRAPRRNSTWHGFQRSGSTDVICVTPALMPRDVWAEYSALPSFMIPGTLAFHKYQGHTMRDDSHAAVFNRSGPLMASPARTKSQPALDVEHSLLTHDPPMRRSSSLHGLRSVCAGQGSGKQLYSVCLYPVFLCASACTVLPSKLNDLHQPYEVCRGWVADTSCCRRSLLR
jgi:hypothetical protein